MKQSGVHLPGIGDRVLAFYNSEWQQGEILALPRMGLDPKECIRCWKIQLGWKEVYIWEAEHISFPPANEWLPPNPDDDF